MMLLVIRIIIAYVIKGLFYSSIHTSKIILFIIYLLEDEQGLSLGMLIRLQRIYNFWSIHAIFTSFINVFGTIFIWTNLLIQCQRPVPVFYCFWFYRSKIHGAGTRWNFCEFFWNISDFWAKESTQEDARGPHKGRGRGHPLAVPPWPLWAIPKVGWSHSFAARKLILWRKNRVKISARSELRISGYKRNGARLQKQFQKVSEKQRENKREEIQSRRGSRPSGRHGGQGPEGRTSPHLGGGHGGRSRRGSLSPLSLPVAPECRRGNHHRGDRLHQRRRLHQHLHHLPHLFSAVHSPATRCNPLLEHGVLVLWIIIQWFVSSLLCLSRLLLSYGLIGELLWLV